MNWLAHIHLAQLAGCELAPSLLPDLMNVRNLESVTLSQARAIAIHQAIDRFTDQHALVLHSKGLISVPYTRFAGVLVDIFYDYCLCQHWQHHSKQALAEFLKAAHQAIQTAIPEQPLVTQPIFERLLEQQWLASYSSHAGIALSLARISQRIKRPTDLAPAVEQLIEHEARFQADFAVFYPELCAHVKALP